MHHEETARQLRNFCRNILWLRKTCGLTQKQMAKLLHISVRTLRQIEHGVLPQCVTVEILDHIRNLFGLMPSQVFEELYPADWNGEV